MPTDLDTIARSAASAVREATRTVPLRSFDEPTERVARPRRVIGVFAVATVLAVVALVLITTRGADQESDIAGTPAPSSNEQRLLPDRGAVPADLTSGSANDDAFAESSLTEGPVVRIYSSSTDAPEQGPAIELWSAPLTLLMFNRPDDAETVTVRDIPATVHPNGHDSWTVVAGPYDGIELQLVGHHLTRDEVLAAAQTAQPLSGRIGAALDTTSLPAGVVERSIGTLYEVMYFPDSTLTAPVPVTGVMYRGAGDRMVWWFVARQPSAEMAYGRLFYDTVTDTTVHGQPAYFGTTSGDAPFRALSWAEGDRTIVMGSRNLSAEELLALAESLHVATDAEWAELASSASDVDSQADTSTTVVDTTAFTPIAPPSTNAAGFAAPITPARVLVANAAGVAGLAGQLTALLPDDYVTEEPTNAVGSYESPLILAQTKVLYAPGFGPLAEQLADELGATYEQMPDTPPVTPEALGNPDLIVLVGQDHRTGWPTG